MSFLTSQPPPSLFCVKSDIQPCWHYLAVSFLGQTSHGRACHLTRVQASYNTKDFQPIHHKGLPAYPSPMLHLPLAPQLSSSGDRGCAYADGRWYLRACASCNLRRMSGCHLCQSPASLSAPEPGPWQQCGFSPVIQTMIYGFSVVSAP